MRLPSYSATAITVATTLMLSASAPTQSYEWQNPDQPFALTIGTALAYDSANARTVLVRGDQTWLWDGAQLERAVLANPMGTRFHPSIAYDSQRNVTVFFGGNGIGTATGTFEWKGSQWTRRTTLNEPSPRWFAGMTYDSTRQVVLLYGGDVNGTLPGDTWQFDGNNWRQLSPPTTPTPRSRHGLVHDPVRGVTLLHGGLDAGNNLNGETWQWNGNNWQRLFPSTNPAPRSAPSVTFDSHRGQVVMHGGTAFPVQFDETWEWDGSDWTLVVPAPSGPTVNANRGIAFDELRGECVLQDNVRGDSATWTYDGANWQRVVEQEVPGYRIRTELAFDEDRGEILMFGRDPANFPLSETWLYRTGSWRRGTPSTVPPEREDPALAFDPSLRGVLMFGGSQPGVTNETWLWNGDDWSLRTPTTVPAPRTYAAMATDPTRSRVVLFGGVGTGGEYADTWEWDGVDWLLQQPATIPSPRQGHAMAYDPSALRVMMFGGGHPLFPPTLGDQWEWDGTNWTQIIVPGMPASRGGAGLVWDESSQSMLLIGGHDFVVAGVPVGRNDLWEWQGSQWTQRTTTTLGPFPLTVSRATHDPLTRRTMLFSASLLAQTPQAWLLAPTSTVAVSHYGLACRGTFGDVGLRLHGLPVLGNRHLRLETSAAPANALTFFAFGWRPLSLALGGGCTALVDPFTTLATFASGRGLATMPLALPNSSALQGLDLRVQSATIDPGGSLGGVGALSDAIKITIDT